MVKSKLNYSSPPVTYHDDVAVLCSIGWATPFYMRQPIGNRLRFTILDRDNFTCRYCGATSRDAKLEVDHINPVYLGGKNDENNLITACKPCNIGKNKHELRGILPKNEENFSLKAILEEELRNEVAEIYQIWFDSYKKSPMWRMKLNVLVDYKRKNEGRIIEILKQCVAKYKDHHDAYIEWVWALQDNYRKNEPISCDTSMSDTKHIKNTANPLKPTT